MDSFISIQDFERLKEFQVKLSQPSNNAQDLAEYVLNSVYATSNEGITLVIHEIFTALLSCINFIYVFVDLIKILAENLTIPIKEIIFDEVMSTQPICVKKLYLYVLKQLFKEGIFSVSDIEDFSQNYRHCSREELFIVFYTFAPDLCKTKSDVYIIYYEKFHHRFMFNAFDVILVDFDKYAENDWALLDRMLTEHVEKDSIQYILKTDDLDSLINICTQSAFDINKQIFYSIFSPHDMLSSASPIEIAAFFSSVRCFKYLLVNNAVVNCRLAHYAVAGGNLEIVRICAQHENIAVSDAIETAVRYRRTDICEWMLENYLVKAHALVAALINGATWNSAVALSSIIQAIKQLPHDENMKNNFEKAANQALERSHKCLGMHLAAEATTF